MRYPQGHIVVLAKAPRPGHVKTRLIPALGAVGAARLQRQLLLRTLQMLEAAALCPVSLYCDPGISHPFFRYCRERFGVQLVSQQGIDLGQRMRHAAGRTLRHAEFTLLLGADCVGVQGQDLEQACAALADGLPVVLGPAEDGGYVLLGLRRGSRGPFSGMAWGGSTVLAQTRSRLRAQHVDWLELPVRWDVDRPADLRRLRPLRMLRL